MLYEASQGWLFSGDLFVGGKDRASVRPRNLANDRFAKVYRALPITCLFPGSARIRENPLKN